MELGVVVWVVMAHNIDFNYALIMDLEINLEIYSGYFPYNLYET